MIADDDSTFLNGALINSSGIILDQNSPVPLSFGVIEFSFNGTNRIIRTNFKLVLSDKFMFLKFLEISKSDVEFINIQTGKNPKNLHSIQI